MDFLSDSVLGALLSVENDVLIVHSHQATLEVIPFYGIFLVPEDVHHYSNSLFSLLHAFQLTQSDDTMSVLY